MTSPIMGLPGAVPPPDNTPDPGVPWHFGDPFAEQRTASRGVAVFDRSHRGVVAVPGEERLTWLHTLLSQHVTGLADGTGTETLVLDTQGRVDLHAVLAHLDGTVWLDLDPGHTTQGALKTRQSLAEYLTAMRFWSKVEPRDATAELAVLTVLGPDAPELLVRLGVPALDRPYQVAALDGGGFARRMPGPGSKPVDLLVPRADLAAWWTRFTDAGARPAGTLAFEALRVAALRPRIGLDTDDRTIPQEVNWIDVAVHLEKGCYRGQETVSRVHNLGRPPRRMVLLHLDGASDALPEPGDPVRLGDRTLGRVGTVVQHHELGPIALALLKRSAATDVEYLAGADDRSVPAAVDPDSVPPDTGVPPGRQAIERLRG